MFIIVPICYSVVDSRRLAGITTCCLQKNIYIKTSESGTTNLYFWRVNSEELQLTFSIGNLCEKWKTYHVIQSLLLINIVISLCHNIFQVLLSLRYKYKLFDILIYIYFVIQIKKTIFVNFVMFQEWQMFHSDHQNVMRKRS